MKKKCCLLGFVLLFLCGCGTTAKETLYPVTRTAAIDKPKKLVILPFADHTPADSPLGYWQRNVLLMESLQDEILRYGHTPAIQEDVIGYLAGKGIIQESKDEKPLSGASILLEAELKKEWSDRMKLELSKALYQNSVVGRGQSSQAKPYWNNRRLLPLDHNTLTQLGSAFGADYIVRGRILVFRSGQEDSFDPAQTGLLPFFFKVGTRTIFGVAQSETYEMIDQMAVGGILGAAIAQGNWPVAGSSSSQLVGHPRFGGGVVTAAENTSGLNAAIWGAAGAGLAHLAQNSGRVDSAVVQLRMLVQDARTGEIVWTNRAEVKVTPESVFGERDENTLIARAIQAVSASLIDNFIASETAGKVVRLNADGSLSTDLAGKAQSDHDGGAAAVQKLINSHVAMQRHPDSGADGANRSMEELEALARLQGSGEITLFFPLGSSVLAETEQSRLVRFADKLSRGAQGRKLLLVSAGSASSIGDERYNQQLAQKRSMVPRDSLKKLLVNIPHEFHGIYGTGELYSPKNVPMAEHQRYQHVRIVAVFEGNPFPENLNPPPGRSL